MLGGGRDRPKVQRLEVIGGVSRTVFRLRNLPVSDAVALVVATRRVRNNLFHGGKEYPLEESYPGDDQEWAAAA